MSKARWVLTAFGVGAGIAFVAGLLRKRRLVLQTGYEPPESATGLAAVPEPSTDPEAMDG